MQIEMFLVIVAIFLCVSLWIFHDLIYERGHRKGFKEGLHTFEELHKDMVAAEGALSGGVSSEVDEEVTVRVEKTYLEGYTEGYTKGFKEGNTVGDDLIDEELFAALEDEDDGNSDEFTGGQIIGPLSERVTDKSEYDCKRCVFADTPYCEKCNVIKLAGGGEGKPSLFFEASEVDTEIDCASNIKEMIDKWEPIPLRIVNWYNDMAKRKP